MPRLEELHLAGNQLGPAWHDFAVPANATSLRMLDLADNQFSGGLPTDLGDLRRLRMLDVSGNAFSGPLPESTASLAQLEFLSTAGSRLSDVPENLNLTAWAGTLRMLDLSDTTLPSDFAARAATLDSLQELRMDRCGLHGSIPSLLLGLPELRVLSAGAWAPAHPCGRWSGRDSAQRVGGFAAYAGGLGRGEQELCPTARPGPQRQPAHRFARGDSRRTVGAHLAQVGRLICPLSFL